MHGANHFLIELEHARPDGSGVVNPLIFAAHHPAGQDRTKNLLFKPPLLQ
jgi:hypothetical protein